MLSRAAQVAAKTAAARFSTSARFAAKGRFVPAGAKPPKPPRVPQPPASGPARQTSPGTSLPKDETWKAQDGIKFAAPAAAAKAATPASETHRPTADAAIADDASANTKASPHLNTEPTSQPGPNAAAAEEAPEPQPTGPLPDLRQGIPSTFDFEFNKKEPSTQNPTEQKITGEETPESAQEAAGAGFGGGRRGGEEGDEQYDREAYETSFDKRRAKMANYGYLSLLAFTLAGTAYFTRPYAQDEAPQNLEAEHVSGWSPNSMYARVRSRMSSQAAYYTEPTFQKLLPDVPEAQRPPFTLVLSLEDLLIHSAWSREHGWRTAKRPGVDYFIKYLSQYYELVLFTSVPVAMADPVIKKLDPFHIIQWPLFREATKYENGEYVKDLNYLNRPLDKVIMIDTKASHVKNNPENA